MDSGLSEGIAEAGGCSGNWSFGWFGKSMHAFKVTEGWMLDCDNMTSGKLPASLAGCADHCHGGCEDGTERWDEGSKSFPVTASDGPEKGTKLGSGAAVGVGVALRGRSESGREWLLVLEVST